jgi:hypothetical protein
MGKTTGCDASRAALSALSQKYTPGGSADIAARSCVAALMCTER